MRLYLSITVTFLTKIRHDNRHLIRLHGVPNSLQQWGTALITTLRNEIHDLNVSEVRRT